MDVGRMDVGRIDVGRVGRHPRPRRTSGRSSVHLHKPLPRLAASLAVTTQPRHNTTHVAAGASHHVHAMAHVTTARQVISCWMARSGQASCTAASNDAHNMILHHDHCSTKASAQAAGSAKGDGGGGEGRGAERARHGHKATGGMGAR